MRFVGTHVGRVGRTPRWRVGSGLRDVCRLARVCRWPLWLAPVRAAIIPVGEAQHAYAARVRQQLMDGHTDEADDVLPNNDGATYIVETDDGGESVAKRVRNAITHAVPYVLVVGHEEESSGTVSVRRRGSADTQRMSIGDLLREWARRLRAFE